jgi:hypothetical protein
MVTRNLPLVRGGRVLYSARLHSRIIDSIGRGRPFVRRGCGKSGGRSKRPESKRWLRMRLASADHPASSGSLLGNQRWVFQQPANQRRTSIRIPENHRA